MSLSIADVLRLRILLRGNPDPASEQLILLRLATLLSVEEQKLASKKKEFPTG